MTNYNLITDGLVACWKSSEYAGGTTWTDSIASKALTLSSAPSTSSDGLEFTSSITFTSESLASLGVSYPCTFEWLGRIDSSSFSNSTPADVFCLGNANGTWSGCINCYAKSSTNGVQLDLNASGAIKSGIYTAGIEYHILVTVNSSGTATMYVNSTTASGTYSSNSANTNSKNYLSNTEGSGRFVGSISRMSLWNKELSSSEISTLFSEQVNTYSVSFDITNGTITSPSTLPATVNEGDDLTVVFNGEDGTEFGSMTVNGESVVPTLLTDSYQYVISDITEDKTVSIVFKGTNGVYMKVSSNWKKAEKVFKKEGSSWVEIEASEFYSLINGKKLVKK